VPPSTNRATCTYSVAGYLHTSRNGHSSWETKGCLCVVCVMCLSVVSAYLSVLVFPDLPSSKSAPCLVPYAAATGRHIWRRAQDLGLAQDGTQKPSFGRHGCSPKYSVYVVVWDWRHRCGEWKPSRCDTRLLLGFPCCPRKPEIRTERSTRAPLLSS